jgi:hypothetical protein
MIRRTRTLRLLLASGIAVTLQERIVTEGTFLRGE